jgi:ABC-type Fe3+/spermidine/putrescine transport system ATPase subunit
VTEWVVESFSVRVGGFRVGPVDLRLAPGTAVGILGRSGAGKTTLLRGLAGLLPADSGRLLRDGMDLTDSDPASRRLGYVPDGLALFPHLTVERNVRYPLVMHEVAGARERARTFLERFGLTRLQGRYVSQLSAGERQRVALARALAADPELIVWDEPWQGLDVEARADLVDVLHGMQIREKVPVVLVTHDADLAFSTADTFVVLEGGQVLYQGAPEGVLRHPRNGFLARFVGFENVYFLAELDAAAGEWHRRLIGAAGPGGVAFAGSTVRLAAAGSGRGTSVVRAVRPAPGGPIVELDTQGLPVIARPPGLPGTGLPRVGDRVDLVVSDDELIPLDGSPSPP